MAVSPVRAAMKRDERWFVSSWPGVVAVSSVPAPPAAPSSVPAPPAAPSAGGKSPRSSSFFSSVQFFLFLLFPSLLVPTSSASSSSSSPSVSLSQEEEEEKASAVVQLDTVDACFSIECGVGR